MVPIPKRLLVTTALLALFAGALLAAVAGPGQPGNPAPAPSAGRGTTMAAAASVATPRATTCVDLPISSAVIQPASCWETGPTAMLVAGSTPGQAEQGALALISGQSQKLLTLPAAGSLLVVSARPGYACVEDGHGLFHSVNLLAGKIATEGDRSCPGAPPSGPGSLGTKLLANTITSNQSNSEIPPAATPSYYEYYAYLAECGSGATSSCPLYQQGQATAAPSTPSIVVLDFGAPCSTLGSPVVYGTQMYESSTCTPDSSLQQLTQDWLDGYESDHGAGTAALTLALGTSNSQNGIDPGPSYEPVSLQQSAQAWYQLVSGSYSLAGAAPVVFWGASDLEQASSGWWDSADSVFWVQYYSEAAGFSSTRACSLAVPGMLADYGDDIVGGSGQADGWTAANVYQVSQGVPGACAVPEIYFGSMAAEWSALSSAFTTASGQPGIAFTGVMVEGVSGTLSASAAWTALESDTGQTPAIPALTQIAPYDDFQVQSPPPQVTGVAPAYGSSAGGTQVTVSGANFYGVSQVYFGQAAAETFTVDSPNAITAVSPPGSLGTVAVVVEASLGSSPATSADGFLYTAPPCTSISVTLADASAAPGYSDLVTPQASCPQGATPSYAYFTGPGSSGPWTLQQGWTASAWSWDTAGLSPGTYYVLVWASDGPTQLAGVQPSPQVEGTAALSLQVPTDCASVAATVSPATVTAGTSATVSASASCPPGAAVEYSYFTRPAAGGSWALQAAWTGPSWTWPTAGLTAGTYQVLVWASDGPYSVPQSQAGGTLTVIAAGGGATACTALAVDGPGSVEVGGTASISATASCPSGADPEYSYFTRSGTGGGWALQAAWIGASWGWSTAGLAPGTYQVLVWASDGPFTVPQVQQTATVTITGPAACTAVTESAPSYATAGAAVAVTASSSCPSGSPAEYSYFTRLGSAGAWTLQAAWIGADWTWSTAGLVPGTYQVLVWVSDGPYSVPQAESQASVNLMTNASCSSVAASVSPASVGVGGVVAVSAAADCPSGTSVEYSYFLGSSPAGPWTLEEAWAGDTYDLGTATLSPGEYYALVWASDGPYTVPQVEAQQQFYVSGSAACSAVSVALGSQSVTSGTAVTVNAAATCPSGGVAEYSYFLGPSAAGPWTLEAAWQGASFAMPTVSLAAGQYYALVWASDGPYTVPQVQGSASFQVTGPGPCSAASVSTYPTSIAAGMPVSVTASATCPAGTSPEYAYFVGPTASGPWSLQDAWVGANWNWSTASLSPGTYYVLVWASDGPYTVPQVEAQAAVTIG